MTGQAAAGPRAALAGVLSAAVNWLVEPADPAEVTPLVGPAPASERPVIAVVGLGPRCGATTVARGLAIELAGRDVGGACAVTAAGPGAGSVPIGSPAAGRLARTLAPVAGGSIRACGRLCLVRCADRAALAGAVLYLAPLVLDVDDGEEASAASAVADRVLLVAGPQTEPALAAVAAQSLSRVGPAPLVVVNRSGGGGPWAERDALPLPDARLGAQLAQAGRDPRGELGRALANVADRLA